MLLIKIGGGASINLEGITEDLVGIGKPFVVIHGANALRDELGERLGIRKQVLTSVSGYDSVYSDAEAVDLILMAYAGLRNKRIVELFQQRGVNAIGLTGLDGALVRGRRNPGIRVRQGGKTLIRRDLSGKPAGVNAELLRQLLDHGLAPVLTIPILDERGFAINSENDDILVALNEGLRAERVIQLIEAPGFLEAPDDPGSLVPRMSRAEVGRREAAVSGRMKRKMLALKRLVAAGGTRVVIADGRVAHPVRDALAGRGTVIE
ncbi:MAG: [LysW]-aminoadipate kinase [Acidobacteria bacterium]|nr:[LysW]-aminoadipate kinase [Acidobacteriota bacterium]MYE43907.1 [LysW]-aminoadipate kinase [Acidobacteriota bacterium]